MEHSRDTQSQYRFEGLQLRRVTHGYFSTHCTSLNGLAHELGVHFHPRGDGGLVEIEFFRASYLDLAGSYQEFQCHLEATLFFSPRAALSSPNASFAPAAKTRKPASPMLLIISVQASLSVRFCYQPPLLNPSLPVTRQSVATSLRTAIFQRRVNPRQPLLVLLRAKRRAKRIILAQNFCHFLGYPHLLVTPGTKKDGVY